MRNKVVVIFGFLIIASIAFLFFKKDYEITNYPPSGTNIIAFGDSLVQGIGATEGNDFVSILSREIGVPIINAGVSGNTTAQGLARLQSDVLSKDPKIVIVLLGGNDYLRRVEKPETFSNLQKIVDQIHARGAVVVLLGVRGGLLRDTYEADYANFAKRNKVAYVPNVLDGLLGNDELMSDQIHPNDRGYKIIAERVRPVVERIID